MEAGVSPWPVVETTKTTAPSWGKQLWDSNNKQSFVNSKQWGLVCVWVKKNGREELIRRRIDRGRGGGRSSLCARLRGPFARRRLRRFRFRWRREPVASSVSLPCLSERELTTLSWRQFLTRETHREREREREREEEEEEEETSACATFIRAGLWLLRSRTLTEPKSFRLV